MSVLHELRREHAKTRGMANIALNNTARLYTLLRRLIVIGTIGFIALWGAILSLCLWLRAS